MAFQAVPDVCEGIVVFQYSSELFWQNTFHFEREGGYTQAQVDTLATTLDGWAGIQARPLISSDVNYHHVEVRGLAFENDLFSLAQAGAGAGTLGAGVSSLNQAYAIKRVTGLTGRSARGRIYWAGFPKASVVANSLTQAYADNIVSALENMQTSVGIIGWTMVVVSRRNAGAARPTGITFPITGWSNTDTQVDTMRKRLPG